MPKREDERGRSTNLRYCVFCQRYMSVGEWATHPHNPYLGVSRTRARLRRALIIIAVVVGVAALLWLLGDSPLR
ncbi:MAG: hypothetical protein V3U31_04785 [Dehalococcoidia bacterium]